MSNRGAYKPSQEADDYHRRSEKRKPMIAAQAHPKKKKPAPKAKFDFGKYNGRDIEEIRFKDKSYFDWAYKTIERFRDLVDSLELAAPRPRRPARATAETHGLVVAKYNPDAVTAEGWNNGMPCWVIDDYKRRLADEPLLPWLHPRHMGLDPAFDPAEELADPPPW